MAGKWRERPLAELTDNFDGMRVPVKESNRRPGPYPYYGASGVVDYVDNYLFDGEYLLVAEDGENLRTRKTPVAFLARGKFWVNNHAHIVRGNAEGDTRFLMYALSSTDISGHLTGSTMPKLTQANLNRIPVLAPPLHEQRAIAQILGMLDDKIELNRRTNETLETLARELFENWFVGFEPVRAKLDGRALSGLDSATAALFPASFQDSLIGSIPTAWELKPLGEIADVNWGDTNTTKRSYVAHGFTAYSAAGPDGLLPHHDYDRTGVVVSAIGSAGLSWLAFGKWSCIKNTIRFWATAKGVSTEYLYQATKGQAKWPIRGSVQPFISQSDARAMRVLTPANGLAERYGETVRPWFATCELNKLESSTLAALRNTLLPKLLTGELRVPKAARAIESALV